MVPAVYVIDDFLPDPEALRARALGLTYRARGNYPGRDSLERLPIDGLDDAVSAIMRQRFRAQTGEEFSHAKCRLPGFGDGIENGRLVYLMFFKVAA